MMKYILILAVILLNISAGALADDAIKPGHRITTRADLVYYPVGNVKMPSSDIKLNYYDSFAFKLSGDYFISDYISLGPGIEYLSRSINPDATFSADIKVVGLYLDSRFSYPVTASGKSYLVFGLGAGMVNITEVGNSGDNGPGVYGIAGFDIGLRPDFGLDLLYRYGYTKVELKNIREYRFESWTIQAGLSYRFKF